MWIPETIIVIWHEVTHAGRARWYLRGVDRDGAFYGEIQWEALHTNVEGLLNDDDNQRLHAIVDRIRAESAEGGVDGNPEAWRGLLAAGPKAAPSLVLRYRQGDEDSSNAAKGFLQVVELLRNYLPVALPEEWS